MIDNTHVVVLRGTGREMVPVPEWRFRDRFGFQFAAHEIGDSNAPAGWSGPSTLLSTIFLVGRTFADWDDLNPRRVHGATGSMARTRNISTRFPGNCSRVERMQLKPLPAWIPEVYRLHQRLVDVEGYVALNTNRYSVPASWIGRRVEVRETKDKIEIQLDARNLIVHTRIAEAERQRVTLLEHRPVSPGKPRKPIPIRRKRPLSKRQPEITGYVAALEATQPQARRSCPAPNCCRMMGSIPARQCWLRIPTHREHHSNRS